MTYWVNSLVFPLARLGGDQPLLGTCFAVGRTVVATANHVVAGDPAGLAMVLPSFQSIQDYQDTSLKTHETVPLDVVASDPVKDLCLLEVTATEAEFTGPIELGSTDEAPVGSLVAAQSYPHANFDRIVLTQHEAKVGARVLLELAGQKFKHMILNTQAREGQSGGPIVVPSTTRAVAVLIGSYAPGGGGGISLGGVDPATLHQTTHAISAEYLQEML